MDRKLMEQMFYEGVMPREQCCPRKKEVAVTGGL